MNMYMYVHVKCCNVLLLLCCNHYKNLVKINFCAEWLPEMGGVTSYILKNEDEEVGGCGLNIS